MNLSHIKGKNKKILVVLFDLLLFNFSYWLAYNIRDEVFIIPKDCKNENANDDYVAFITDDKKWTAIINASGERKLIDNETNNYTITRLNGYLTQHKANGEEIFNHQTLSQVSR